MFGTMKNRKYKGYLIAVGLLILGYVVTHLLKIDAELFKVFIYGLVSLTAIYDGSNILVKKFTGGNK